MIKITNSNLSAEQKENLKETFDKKEIATSALASVREDDPAKQYVVAAIEETVKEFKQSEKYKRLPETEEQAEKKPNVGEKAAKRNDISYEFGEQSYQVAYAMEETDAFQVIV